MVTDAEFRFDSTIADEMAQRWLVLALLVNGITTLERAAIQRAVADAKECQLRLLQSVEPCPESDGLLDEPDWATVVLDPRTPAEVLSDAVDTAGAMASGGYCLPVADVPKKTRRKFTDDEKRAGVRVYVEMGSITRAAKHLNVAVSVLRRWVNDFPPEDLDDDPSAGDDDDPSAGEPSAPDPPDTEPVLLDVTEVDRRSAVLADADAVLDAAKKTLRSVDRSPQPLDPDDCFGCFTKIRPGDDVVKRRVNGRLVKFHAGCDEE